MILIAGSMICSTSSPIRRSCLVAWDRVRGNKGARTAGVDGQTVSYVQMVRGVEGFLDELRAQLRDRSFRPLPARERMIPKAGGKRRRLGIAAVRDRVVQASLKLVLEPIFEADFLPCSYGFRPNRRTHDAVAEMRHLTSHSYEWIVEGDITACFDEISHSGLMDRVRERVGDKRVLALVKAFLKAGILGEDRVLRATDTGIEVILRAGELAGCPVIDELVLHTALILSEQAPTDLQILVQPLDQDGRRPFSVHSRTGGQHAAAWTLHASGALSADQPAASPPPSRRRVWRPSTRTTSTNGWPSRVTATAVCSGRCGVSAPTRPDPRSSMPRWRCPPAPMSPATVSTPPC